MTPWIALLELTMIAAFGACLVAGELSFRRSLARRMRREARRRRDVRC